VREPWVGKRIVKVADEFGMPFPKSDEDRRHITAIRLVDFPKVLKTVGNKSGMTARREVQGFQNIRAQGITPLVEWRGQKGHVLFRKRAQELFFCP
jgi:hypothetical protein